MGDERYDEQVARRGIRISECEVRAWNMKEFCFRDPHGNLLRFGATPVEIDRTGSGPAT